MSEIKEHAAQGGIFGIEKATWVAALEKENHLKSAEMSTEDDYGMIDGINPEKTVIPRKSKRKQWSNENCL